MDSISRLASHVRVNRATDEYVCVGCGRAYPTHEQAAICAVIADDDREALLDSAYRPWEGE